MIGFYFDEHMNRVVADALRQRGYHVVMAVDVGMEGKPDEVHLAYATKHDLVMVTFGHPFAGRTQMREDFLALVCLSHKLRSDIGRMIATLNEFGQLFDRDKDSGQVYWPS